MIFGTLFSFLTGCTPAAEGEANNQWIMWVLLGVLLIAVIVLPMFTKRKQQKKYEETMSNIHIGDTVKTIGGIVGKVVDLKTIASGKVMIIETGEEGAKSTMTFDINALHSVIESTFKPESAAGTAIATAETPVGEVFDTPVAAEPAETPVEAAEPVAETPAEPVSESADTVTEEVKKPRGNYGKKK
ncbi:MAG: preprotein translocase subunit YajC [Clostridiales bacterium]|jgi:preprotein translocase subunit YajC|nr:preprotein translocase subunit YajC [Clostridiales bacterium]